MHVITSMWTHAAGANSRKHYFCGATVAASKTKCIFEASCNFRNMIVTSCLRTVCYKKCNVSQAHE
jgi:hypothetical protein